jgi:hypothetical protein
MDRTPSICSPRAALTTSSSVRTSRSPAQRRAGPTRAARADRRRPALHSRARRRFDVQRRGHPDPGVGLGWLLPSLPRPPDGRPSTATVLAHRARYCSRAAAGLFLFSFFYLAKKPCSDESLGRVNRFARTADSGLRVHHDTRRRQWRSHLPNGREGGAVHSHLAALAR